jgi:hypothetical protein
VEAVIQRKSVGKGTVEGFGFRPLDMPEGAEEALTGALASGWGVKLVARSLRALQSAISDQNAELGGLINRRRLQRDDSGLLDALDDPRAYNDIVTAMTSGLDRFQEVLPDHANERWALLFDELELAPRWLQDYLMRSTRSVDARLLFKLAISPYDDAAVVAKNERRAAPDIGHDFEEVPLWYTDKGKGREFCEELWDEVVEQRLQLGMRIKPSQILGRSAFDSPPEARRGKRSAYHPTSVHAESFAELAKIDGSFRAYLKRHRLSPNSLHNLREEQRAALVRKIGPLVLIRLFFVKEYEGTGAKAFSARKRSRKTYPLFSGYESLFAMSEGNPRWFIGIVSQLLELAKSEKRTIRQLEPQEQVDIVNSACNQFRALLRGLPCDVSALGDRGILGLMDDIGDYFFTEQVLEPFTADPPLTFTVDQTAPDALVEALGTALNAGAIVLAPQSRSRDHQSQRWTVASLRTVRGNRFRLSYLLAGQYGLLLRLGEPVSLSTIAKRKNRPISEGGQLLLGDSEA